MTNKIPNIKLGEYGYEGTISLNVWHEYNFNKNKEYHLDIGGDMVEDSPVISDEHVAAYDYMIGHQKEIQDAILSAILNEYPKIIESYRFDQDDAILPIIHSNDDLKKNISLASVHIMNVYKDEIAYVGFEFICSWDGEHGLGLMTYKNQIVEFGGADTSFLSWVAERDLRKESL